MRAVIRVEIKKNLARLGVQGILSEMFHPLRSRTHHEFLLRNGVGKTCLCKKV